jgi:protein phosphatase
MPPHAFTTSTLNASRNPVSGRSVRLEAAGRTDVGVVRWKNEDALLIMENLGVFAVADGMGGAQAGDVASGMLIDTVREVFEDLETTLPLGPEVEHREPAVLMHAALQRANRRIRNAGLRDPKKSGMGTTFAGVAFGDGQVVLAHVGDSRIYRLRDGRLECLTTDHSPEAELIAAGFPPSQSHGSWFLGVLTRAIGLAESLAVDTRLEPLVPGDLYLLSTDGLHGIVAHKEIEAILLGEEHLTAAVGALTARADALGSPDNVTAVLVRASPA